MQDPKLFNFLIERGVRVNELKNLSPEQGGWTKEDDDYWNEVSRKSYHWLRYRDELGLPANFVPGVDKIVAPEGHDQIYGMHPDTHWEDGTPKRWKYDEKGNILGRYTKEEDQSFLRGMVDEMNRLRSIGDVNDSNKIEQELRNTILPHSPAGKSAGLYKEGNIEHPNYDNVVPIEKRLEFDKELDRDSQAWEVQENTKKSKENRERGFRQTEQDSQDRTNTEHETKDKNQQNEENSISQSDSKSDPKNEQFSYYKKMLNGDLGLNLIFFVSD